MSEYIDEELIENTYLYCVKRIEDSETAKDLAQDILLEALRVIAEGKEFFNFYSWYWRMAHNKYAHYMEQKKATALPMEMAVGVVESSHQPIDKIINDEQISNLNYSLSRLASYQREMVIRFYLKEQSVRQISEELNLPIGTVKRRLFDAKKKVKERFEFMNQMGISSYAPAEIDWFWGYKCKDASEVFEHQKIAQQVCVLCYKNHKSINELADEMGVAPIYLEPIVEQLVCEKLLKIVAKNCYLTNFCVFPKQEYINAEAVTCEEFRKHSYGEKITDILYGLKDKILSLDFYGNDFAYDYLMWILYVVAGYQVGVQANEHYLKKYQGKYRNEAEREYRITMQSTMAEEKEPHFLDTIKSVGWSNLHQTFKNTRYGNLEYVNNYEYDPFPVEGTGFQKGRDFWIDGNNISLLLELTENCQRNLNTYEEEIIAGFIKKGLVDKTKNGLKVMLPVFSEAVYTTINDIVREAVQELAVEYAELVSEKVENLLLPYVRKDLMSNFIYWDMKMFFQPISYLFYYGINESGKLQIPKDYEKSAAGLYIMKKVL